MGLGPSAHGLRFQASKFGYLVGLWHIPDVGARSIQPCCVLRIGMVWYYARAPRALYLHRALGWHRVPLA
jgi:hypothetical protein